MIEHFDTFKVFTQHIDLLYNNRNMFYSMGPLRKETDIGFAIEVRNSVFYYDCFIAQRMEMTAVVTSPPPVQPQRAGKAKHTF